MNNTWNRLIYKCASPIYDHFLYRSLREGTDCIIRGQEFAAKVANP